MHNKCISRSGTENEFVGINKIKKSIVITYVNIKTSPD